MDPPIRSGPSLITSQNNENIVTSPTKHNKWFLSSSVCIYIYIWVQGILINKENKIKEEEENAEGTRQASFEISHPTSLVIGASLTDEF